jgi:hypothetical protein
MTKNHDFSIKNVKVLCDLLKGPPANFIDNIAN